MTIDEYLKKNNINPFDDVLDIIDLIKKRAQTTNDGKPILEDGYQAISEKAIKWLFDNHREIYDEFYELS